MISIAGSQSLQDRLYTFKYFVSGQSLSFVVLKATTSELLGPKKKHLTYLTNLTHEPNVSIPNLVKYLIQRVKYHDWTVVFKSLITIHYLISYGNEKFIQNLASSTINRNILEQISSFLDKSSSKAYDMSTFIRRYSRYIVAKLDAYKTLGLDFCRITEQQKQITRRQSLLNSPYSDTYTITTTNNDSNPQTFHRSNVNKRSFDISMPKPSRSFNSSSSSSNNHYRNNNFEIDDHEANGDDLYLNITNSTLKMRTMNRESLLSTLPILQNLFDLLMAFDASVKDLNNGIINSAFSMLYKDFVKLYITYQTAIIRLIELYFKCKQLKPVHEMLNAYKKFLVRMDKVSDFMFVVDSVGMDKSDMPNVSRSPNLSLKLMEKHLESTTSAMTTSGNNSIATISSTITTTNLKHNTNNTQQKDNQKQQQSSMTPAYSNSTLLSSSLLNRTANNTMSSSSSTLPRGQSADLPKIDYDYGTYNSRRRRASLRRNRTTVLASTWTIEKPSCQTDPMTTPTISANTFNTTQLNPLHRVEQLKEEEGTSEEGHLAPLSNIKFSTDYLPNDYASIRDALAEEEEAVMKAYQCFTSAPSSSSSFGSASQNKNVIKEKNCDRKDNEPFMVSTIHEAAAIEALPLFDNKLTTDPTASEWDRKSLMLMGDSEDLLDVPTMTMRTSNNKTGEQQDKDQEKGGVIKSDEKEETKTMTMEEDNNSSGNSFIVAKQLSDWVQVDL